MIERLLVRSEDALVGTLAQSRDGRFEFSYSGEWLARPHRFPISVSLPLHAPPAPGAAHAFFSNLLPESELRRVLSQRLGISADNDFELLAAIGGECAGALTLSTGDEPDRARAADYRPLTSEELETLAAAQVLPAIDGRSGLRLSLAGAQDKLPVLVEGTSLLLPIGSSPSTHILKFPNRHYKHLPGNEVLTMTIAAHLGLPVARTELWELRREGMCVVERYDRVRDASGAVRRLHQEDLCQVLGLRSTMKYQKEGGPSFTRCFEAVREVSAQPLVDGQNLLKWIAFNTIALNADGHAKNLSLLYTESGLRLAPFYDLVCTRAYPRLAPELAMSIGDEFDPTLVRRSHWEQVARELGLGVRFVLGTVRELAERLPEAADAAAAEFRSRYGERPALQLVLPKIRRQAKRVAQLAA